MAQQDYEEFVEKFKPKLTTDDCYTPALVYDAVAGYCEKRYGISRDKFLRPFYPGGDFIHADYPEGHIVVDNPPFSILSKIVQFYNYKNIGYFLFAPHTSTLQSGRCTAVCANCGITYENGAVVLTNFITNLEPDVACRSDPELCKIVSAANDENQKQNKKTLPKYVYPLNVVKATDLNYLAAHGVAYSVPRDDAVFIRVLDSQRDAEKSIFGGGYLISERAAAERAAAERAAAERAAAIEFELSDRERAIIATLGK